MAKYKNTKVQIYKNAKNAKNAKNIKNVKSIKSTKIKITRTPAISTKKQNRVNAKDQKIQKKT